GRPIAMPGRQPTGRSRPKTSWQRCTTCWGLTRTRASPIAAVRRFRSSPNQPTSCPRCWRSWSAPGLFRRLASDLCRAEEFPEGCFMSGNRRPGAGQFGIEATPFAEGNDEKPHPVIRPGGHGLECRSFPFPPQIDEQRLETGDRELLGRRRLARLHVEFACARGDRVLWQTSRRHEREAAVVVVSLGAR